MKKELLIFFCFVSIMCIAQDKIPYFGESSFHYNTYNPLLIKKNNVKSLTNFYCFQCNDSTKNENIKDYKKYFDNNGDESKIVQFKKNGGIYNYDTFINNNEKKYAEVFTVKNKSQKLRCMVLDISVKTSLLNNKKAIVFYKKKGLNKIDFRDSLSTKYYKYELKGSRLKLYYGEENDSLGNNKLIMLPDGKLNQIDTFVYKYDYTKLTGNSTFTINGVKYLHSTVILNKNLQLYQENIFNVEYNKLDVKLAKTIEPTFSKIYHYLENGLIDYIEILTFNNRYLINFTYEFY